MKSEKFSVNIEKEDFSSFLDLLIYSEDEYAKITIYEFNLLVKKCIFLSSRYMAREARI